MELTYQICFRPAFAKMWRQNLYTIVIFWYLDINFLKNYDYYM